MDDDFRPEPPRVLRDFAREHGAYEGLVALSRAAEISPEGAAWAAYDWLQTFSNGLPYSALSDQIAREDARFWAETATPPELECYALAALDRLSGAPFASRQIKRLVAALWGRMSPAEQSAFKAWINREDAR